MPPKPPSPFARLRNAWFPLALLALLFLAVPGFILFALNLLGNEGPVNAWLQDTFNLSYHIPVSWWAAAVLLLVPFLIVLLYFLKLKRRPLQVPSTFLWKKSIEDLHVNSLFQWLRENVLLLLQVLTVLALIYALMAFRFHGKTQEGKHYIVMIDNSASMAATDVGPSRLEQAKKEALAVIDGHSDSDFGMVIVFSSSAEILQSYTNDRPLLRNAIESIVQSQRPTRIEDALSLADSLANPTRSTENEAARPAGEEAGKERTYVTAEGIPTELHLFSDGRFADIADFALGNLSVDFHLIGKLGADNVNNVGIVNLNALRDEQDPSKMQAFVRVLNFTSKPVLSKIELEVFVNGASTGVREKQVRLLGRQFTEEKKEGREEVIRRDVPGEGNLIFDLPDLDDRSNIVLHAQLKNVHVGSDGSPADAFRDDFPLDDQAWLVAGVVRKARILIVGPPNKLLQDFFDQEATQAVANVTYLVPADLKDEKAYRGPARDGAFDLVIFDRCTPEKVTDLPFANTFFIDAVPPPWKKEEMPKLEAPRIRGWDTKHPLLQYLRGLQDIGIAEAFRFDLADPRVPPRTPRLLESTRDAVLMFALSRQSFTDVVMTFALLNDKGDAVTNWWRQISFPLFLRNLLYTLGGVNDAASEASIQPGQPKTLRPDLSVKQIEVEDPSKHREKIDRGVRADFSFAKTEQTGVYHIRYDGDAIRRSFAVNLFDADESNIQPRSEIQIGQQQIAAGETPSSPRDMWKWVVLAALVLLLMEWWVYNRRVYI